MCQVMCSSLPRGRWPKETEVSTEAKRFFVSLLFITFLFIFFLLHLSSLFWFLVFKCSFLSPFFISPCSLNLSLIPLFYFFSRIFLLFFPSYLLPTFLCLLDFLIYFVIFSLFSFFSLFSSLFLPYFINSLSLLYFHSPFFLSYFFSLSFSSSLLSFLSPLPFSCFAKFLSSRHFRHCKHTLPVKSFLFQTQKTAAPLYRIFGA